MPLSCRRYAHLFMPDQAYCTRPKSNRIDRTRPRIVNCFCAHQPRTDIHLTSPHLTSPHLTSPLRAWWFIRLQCPFLTSLALWPPAFVRSTTSSQFLFFYNLSPGCLLVTHFPFAFRCPCLQASRSGCLFPFSRRVRSNSIFLS